MTATPPKKSDLGVRALSAVVMIAVAGTALWLGGWVWAAFVVAVALGVLWEWWGLVRAISTRSIVTVLWLLAGLTYIGIAADELVYLGTAGTDGILLIVGGVIAVDVGAYFAGRTFGGPKIAPSISPSKTWAGLAGGTLGAAAVAYLSMSVFGLCYNDGPPACFPCFRFDWSELLIALGLGIVFAIVAQSGDFFESWMKRRAGVKDSGKLIPGHGGLFDRVDGLLTVAFVLGLWRHYLLAVL